MKKLPYAALLAVTVLSSPIAAQAAIDSTAAQRALQLIRDNAALSRASLSDVFTTRSTLHDANGAEHVRFDRSYKGLPVIGGDLVVHSDARGRLTGVSQTLARSLSLDIAPAYTGTQAIQAANAQFAGRHNGTAVARLSIYARQAAPALAYDVTVRGTATDGTPSVHHFILSAMSLALLDDYDTVQTAASTGTGKSLISGTVPLTTDSQSSGYALRDPSRGGHYTVDMRNLQVGAGVLFTDADNVWGNYATSDRATVGVDATFGQNLTWDYYKLKFGRNGIANDGAGAYSRVHYSRGYVNAFWSDDCFCMTYGDGDGGTYLPLVAIDVAGHEMTHGVTSRTAGLIYSGESGGLNEAISDMFGTLVEFYANETENLPNYLIGERVYAANNGVPVPTTALRYMFKPSLDGISPDCYVPRLGRLNVHYSSGVANHWFYLLAEGATVPAGFSSLTPASLVCAGSTALAAQGRDVVAQIVYRALTVYMTSSTDYAGARAATLSAAADLYGSTSSQVAAVAAAWTAVGVN